MNDIVRVLSICEPPQVVWILLGNTRGRRVENPTSLGKSLDVFLKTPLAFGLVFFALSASGGSCYEGSNESSTAPPNMANYFFGLLCESSQHFIGSLSNFKATPFPPQSPHSITWCRPNELRGESIFFEIVTV